MAERIGVSQDLKAAVELALAGKWEEAHAVAQRLGDEPRACWLHGVLHKIEGDTTNARYWYAQCDRDFNDFSDNEIELAAIRDLLADDLSHE